MTYTASLRVMLVSAMLVDRTTCRRQGTTTGDGPARVDSRQLGRQRSTRGGWQAATGLVILGRGQRGELKVP